MQGLHHQQQQLAALIKAALPKDETSKTNASHAGAPTAANGTPAPAPEDEESSRLSAVNSLHRAVLYPPNSILVTHSVSFIAQGVFQLLSDKSYPVRQAAATAYGALSSVLCSISISSNGRQNPSIINSLIDRFIAWSLSSLTHTINGNSELALHGLHEFLNVGDFMSVERFSLPILKACQELLEDEKTSVNLLHRLLAVLTLISLKFFRSFQPHFVDVVDLLLGWAMVPDISESDKRVIMDSFLQFQKHWVNNMQFSLGLLSKFLGDMDLLLQDGSPGTPQQFKRLLALLLCFCTVLQSVASGLLEINYLEQINEPLSQMVPILLRCLSGVGTKFGWSKWIEDSWRCLTLLAEIMGERFCTVYPIAVDLLFQSLEKRAISAFQVHGVLKTNLQLLSLQKNGLVPSSVVKIVQFGGPVSHLRLHPNHLVTGSAAATYVFLLQHGRFDVVERAMDSLIEELILLKCKLEKITQGDGLDTIGSYKSYSKSELVVLIKFDLKVLLTCIPFGGETKMDTLYYSRAEKLVAFVTGKLDPFCSPIQSSADLQVMLLKVLERLTTLEFTFKSSKKKHNKGNSSSGKSHSDEESMCDVYPVTIFSHLGSYSELLVNSLDTFSPLAVKIEALEWIRKFLENVVMTYKNVKSSFYPCQAVQKLLFSTLYAASDREPKVRSLVATIIEMFLKAKILLPVYFPVIAETILEKLGDPEKDVRNAYLILLSAVLPLTTYICGLSDNNTRWPRFHTSPDLHWKQLFALKQMPRQHLHSQQLVSILGYISQRWKVPLSSWIDRFIHTCKGKMDHSLTQLEEAETSDTNGLWWDFKVDENTLENICSVNHLAGVWWAIHEAARFCVTTRLRTNLGGPTQTFAALERMLLDVSHVLHLETDPNDGNLNIIASYAHLLPMRLLLEFVEALKKNVYNAYEGSIILPHASRQSSLFFRANKKVCEEWFSRINEPMMDTGLTLQCHDATIHYSALRLQDLGIFQVSENLENILGILRKMSLALCKNREPEALIGLRKWAEKTFSPSSKDENRGPEFSWITGLVYQSRGQHEKASAHYINLLQTEESLTSMGSDGVQFAISRIIESYTAISDWKSLDSWLFELQTIRAKNAGKSYAGALTTTGNELNSVQALAQFDEGDFQTAWSYLDLTPKSSNDLTLDPRLALQRSEQMLLQAMLLNAEGKVDDVSDELQKAKLMLEETLSVLPLDRLVDAAPHVNQLYCISAFQRSCLNGEGEGSLLDTYIRNFFPCNNVHQDCSLWLKVLRVYQNTVPNSPATLDLCMNLMILARKQKNLMLATRLGRYLELHASLCSDGNLRDYFVSSVKYESILVMQSEKKAEGALANLWSFVHPLMIDSSNGTIDSYDDVLKAKACLKLSNWLLRDVRGRNLEGVIRKMQADFNNTEVVDGNQSSNLRVDLIVQELVGTARKLSTHNCPLMGKSWILYASWCYSQAKASVSSTHHESALRSCSFSPILDTEIQPDRFVLTEEEQLRVKDIIREHEGTQTEIDLEPLLQQLVNAIEDAAGAGAPGVEDCSLSAVLSSQLQKILLSANVTLEEDKVTLMVHDMVDVWWCLRRRRVSLFGHAAQGFMNYLSYSSLNGHLTVYDVDSKHKYSSYTLRAMLYVLNIMVNYGAELKDTLEPALSKVPMLPWQEITPQLFARLSSHPDEVVRKQLETLLIMLAKISPWSLVYPTLVEVNSQEKEPSEELQKIHSYLNQLYPRLVQDSQLMIKELENVTVLWEELWLGTLQDLHADVMRRVNLLKEEAARITGNTTLTHGEKNKINAAKYSAMMAPIVVVLERRLASTSRKPETPHETWFLDEYHKKIKSAIVKFKTPPSSTASLGDVWRPFENIASSLVSYQRKSSISLKEVAPNLAFISSSDAPMPGLEKQITTSESGIVTISSFYKQVAILPTKTKPKKLVIVGSDGSKYTYLLKGREDLRLDARIMQLLQAVNGFLESNSATRNEPLVIRYYSVTPISGRAGLIQWVDNVISIYSVFKSWQNRVQLSQLSDTKSTAFPPVARPTDMFYGKIIPALKEKGIRRVISRRDWPHDVKRKVLVDLMEESPKQLLYQELWCASEGFKAFRSKLKRYSGSVAAMSMVGHILGLGDRHLDNILIDFCSGDIVHIDYNICFDKGQRLKIPEIVPFRLTQTIEAALGLTGTEGSFRANCEAILGVLRKNKDIILMLLEVFVWDPLVEWTRANFHDDAAVVGEERRGMELAVSLSLFASRVQEIRVALQEHHDHLLSTLPAIESSIERFSDILNQYEIVSGHFYRADQERSTLIAKETSAKLQLAEATSNSDKAHVLFETRGQEFTQSRAVVMEKARDAATWIEQYRMILDALRSGSIPEIKASGSEESLSLLSGVGSAGIPLTVVPEPTKIQCREIDREVSKSITELNQGIFSAVHALQMYSFILQRILPLNYLTTSPLHGWAQVLISLSSNLSSENISAARRQGGEIVNMGRDQGTFGISRYNDLCQKVTNYAADIERLEEECSQLAISIGPGTESKAKERLLSYTQGKQESVLSILDSVLSNSLTDVKHRICKSLDCSDLGSFLSEFEEQIENCVLVTEVVDELKHVEADATSWASIIKTSLLFSKNFVKNITEVAVPHVVKSVISFNTDVTDIFGSISHIRGSLDTALEYLLQVELEKGSLLELEQNYFLKVGSITEQQLALEEAAVKGRDHLSWEEADEIASQEESCRVQLDQLHHIWNQRESRNSLLTKREVSVNTIFESSEKQFQSLISKNVLLGAIIEHFSELESVDQMLSSMVLSVSYTSRGIVQSVHSVGSLSQYIWKFPELLKNHAFFIWKIFIMDLLLDSCVNDVATSLDQYLGYEQLLHVVKRKVRTQLQEKIGEYLRERVLPIMLTILDTEIDNLRHSATDSRSVRKVQAMLEEYCNAHETVRAAKSAGLIMKRQANEFKEALLKTTLEIAQMEWMHDITKGASRKLPRVDDDDNLLPIILNISRSKLLENIQSSVAKISMSLESIQSCEGASVTAEGQLERAMIWACGAPNSNSAGNITGTPPEFRDHLETRRRLLEEARENASEIMKVCVSILEFEASRDGIFRSTEWQQSYPSALTKLDIAYHSFTWAEQEWKLAQNNVEAASNGLLSAANELSVSSVKAKAASGDFQSILFAMRDSACEACMALSTYGGIIRGHTALTSECGSMLEEVLAITEALHDVHTLGKEAAILHFSLMENLSKANTVLLPLESLLSKDVGAMTESMAREKEISPIHGQAVFQSYHNRVNEAVQVFKPLVQPLAVSLEGLYSMLTRLARAAGLHAGNLHKALEGLGESLQVKSQDVDTSREEDLAYHDILESGTLSESENDWGFHVFNGPDQVWISPPESIESESTDSFIGLDATEVQESPLLSPESRNLQESFDASLVRKDEGSVLNGDKNEEESRGTSVQVHGGKNPYALSILRRVEMKLEGRDITDNREISVAEQVDFLLKQATNMDNLCNMYEGWTPWI